MNAEMPESRLAQQRQRRGRWLVILLFLIFAAPVAISWLLYLNVDRLHLATSNKGELIQPARVLNDVSLPLPISGGTLPAGYWLHRWTLVYVGAAVCDADCAAALKTTGDVRLDLTQHTDDIQRLYLVNGAPADLEKLRGLGAALTVANLAAPGGEVLQHQFDVGDAHAVDGRYIYVVDPHGYLMMRYAVNADPHGMLKDLQHLLGGGEM